MASKKYATDEENHTYLFQSTHRSLLVAIANGEIDPVELAKSELANRGMDLDGNWVGFKSVEPETLEPEIVSFEVGKTYSTRSACDHECIFSYKITRRTDKSVWVSENGLKPEERRKISTFEGVESIYPDGKYSMCPVLRADR